MDLRVDDSVETGPDGLAVFAVGADSSLRVGPRTRLSVTESSPHDVAVRLSHGILRVSERRDVRVSVQTPDVLVRPVGTTYDVRVEGGMTTVIVSEGRVEVPSRERTRPHRGGRRAGRDWTGGSARGGGRARGGPRSVDALERPGPHRARGRWARHSSPSRSPGSACGGAASPTAVPLSRIRRRPFSRFGWFACAWERDSCAAGPPDLVAPHGHPLAAHERCHRDSACRA